MKKKRIALVSVRYGENIVGGAEKLIMNYASILSEFCEVQILTTKSTDHNTWSNDINNDKEIINGISVIRFATDSNKVVDERYVHLLHTISANYEDFESAEEFFLKQGPYSTEMLNYLSTHSEEYDYFIYCPYLYATTYFGSTVTPKEKNILIPAAHDEMFIYLSAMKLMFERFSKVIYLTEEERDLVHTAHSVQYPNSVIGMEIAENSAEKLFIKKYNINGPYIVYVGRVEIGKGVPELIEYFNWYLENYNSNIKLLFIGAKSIDLPNTPNYKYLGFLSEEDKLGAIVSSQLLVLPSRFESFSIVTLEAMMHSVPVLVNGNCAVLKGHCVRSNAGLWYEDKITFAGSLNHIVSRRKLQKEMGKLGSIYVKNNYSRPIISKRLKEALDL